MTSNDNYVTVEMFNGGIAEIKSEIQNMRQEFYQRYDNLQNEIKINTIRIDGVQSSINTGFTTIGIIIGLVGLIIAVISVFKKGEAKPETQNSPTEARVQEMIEMAISRTLARG